MLKLMVLTSLLLVSIAASAIQLNGYVVRITDGDTFTLLVDQRRIVIRLENIDAPEMNQPFGAESVKTLRKLVHGKSVSCNKSGEDRNHRTLATCYVDGLDVNLKMVEQGMAWVFRRYAKKEKIPHYFVVENMARNEAKGLWGGASAIPPWDWRRRRGK